MDEFEGLFARVEAALRVGDYQALSVLSDDIETELRRVTLLPALGEERIEHWRGLARETMLRLEATSRGIGLAQQRLSEVVQAMKGLRSYDGQGRAVHWPKSSTGLPKRL